MLKQPSTLSLEPDGDDFILRRTSADGVTTMALVQIAEAGHTRGKLARRWRRWS